MPPAAEDSYRDALTRAEGHVLDWLGSVNSRHVGPTATVEQLTDAFGGPLQDGPTDPGAVIDELARTAEPGLMAMPSGKFFGWVIGGTLPAALGADWMVSAWDQNAAMRLATPATAAAEEVAGQWLLELLHLPATSAVGFTTGGTTANFVGLAAGRQYVLDRAGWNLEADGMSGSPNIIVLVGEERHTSVDMAMRYLGHGGDLSGKLSADSAEHYASEGYAIVVVRGVITAVETRGHGSVSKVPSGPIGGGGKGASVSAGAHLASAPNAGVDWPSIGIQTENAAISAVFGIVAAVVCVGSALLGCGLAIVGLGSAALATNSALDALWKGEDPGSAVNKAFTNPQNWVDILFGTGAPV